MRMKCQECGGRGVDPGSLHEPEACQVCKGGGSVFLELDPQSSHYNTRRPMGRALPNITAGDFSELKWLGGGL